MYSLVSSLHMFIHDFTHYCEKNIYKETETLSLNVIPMFFSRVENTIIRSKSACVTNCCEDGRIPFPQMRLEWTISNELIMWLHDI